MTESTTTTGKRKAPDGDGKERVSQACLKCRKQKMRCIGADNPPCIRCRKTGSQCEFIPRANAAASDDAAWPFTTFDQDWRNSLLSRVSSLERANKRMTARWQRVHGDISDDSGEDQPATASPQVRSTSANANGQVGSRVPMPVDENGAGPSRNAAFLQPQPSILNMGQYIPERPPTNGLLPKTWQTIELLKSLEGSGSSSPAWRADVITALWESFQNNVPGLHFFSGEIPFIDSTPLLVAAILYVSSSHHASPELTSYQTVYFKAAARAIGALSVPDLPGEAQEVDAQDIGRKRFNNVLGIILVALTTIGWIDGPGTWVSIGYRMVLDGMTEDGGEKLPEWRGLWEGLRSVEFEHCSLNLLPPMLPKFPPDPPFPPHLESWTNGAMTAIAELVMIMQEKLTHFSGRDWPNLRQLLGLQAYNPASSAGRRSDIQMENAAVVVGSWNIAIDHWYAHWGSHTHSSNLYVRAIILTNYHLHKVFALSMLCPPTESSPVIDRHWRSKIGLDLMASARLALRLQSAWREIWSNWDLLIITLASLIVLKAVDTGMGEAEDLKLVQTHLNTLRKTHTVTPSIRHTLSRTLETAMQNMRTPPVSNMALGPVPVHGHPHPYNHQQHNGQQGHQSGLGLATSASTISPSNVSHPRTTFWDATNYPTPSLEDLIHAGNNNITGRSSNARESSPLANSNGHAGVTPHLNFPPTSTQAAPTNSSPPVPQTITMPQGQGQNQDPTLSTLHQWDLSDFDQLLQESSLNDWQQPVRFSWFNSTDVELGEGFGGAGLGIGGGVGGAGSGGVGVEEGGGMQGIQNGLEGRE